MGRREVSEQVGHRGSIATTKQLPGHAPIGSEFHEYRTRFRHGSKQRTRKQGDGRGAHPTLGADYRHRATAASQCADCLRDSGVILGFGTALPPPALNHRRCGDRTGNGTGS